MRKSLLKFLAGGLALVAVAVGVLYLVQYLRHRQSPEYRAEQYFKDLERRYREDPYGGSTPEETLQLFIDALKKGDIELASKYFVLDEQTKWRNELLEIQQNGNLSLMISDLERAKKSKEESERAFFTASNTKGVVSLFIDIRKNVNGKWKILDL